MRSWSIACWLVCGALGCSGSEGDTGGLGGPDQTGDVDSSVASDALGGDGGDDGGFHPGEVAPPCKNLQCQQVKCDGTSKTTVSGVVFDPAGKVPLYNVVVYVPNAKVAPFTTGATCDRCGAVTGEPIVTTLTDTRGRFVLEDVPVGKDIPLVMQVGKWRRQVVIPEVGRCVDTPLTGVDRTRLPRNQAEGDIPQMALSTGGADPLECLLRKIGLDDKEFTPKGGAGRVHLYSGVGGGTKFDATVAGGAAYAPGEAFWSSVDTLKAYDVVLLACEGVGEDQVGAAKPVTARQAMLDYTSLGGRVFASHLHKFWFLRGPDPFPSVATFVDEPDLPNPTTAFIDTGFPKGLALADWLVNVGASTTPKELVIKEAQHTVNAVSATASQRWIYGTSPDTVMYFTFNTPIAQPVDKQCGRVVFSDIHVSSGDAIAQPFPTGCTTKELSPQEKALEFMLFDLSSCVSDDGEKPTPPK